jgi:hypothetical protein
MHTRQALRSQKITTKPKTMKNSRRDFIKRSTVAAAGTYLGALGFSAKSYGNIIGANDRVRVGVVGFSDRFKSSLLPSFFNHYKELNFDMVAVSDIWKVHREEGQAILKQKFGHDIKPAATMTNCMDQRISMPVIISTADFQHAFHTIEAVKAGCDTYTEKPFAESMETTVRP